MSVVVLFVLLLNAATAWAGGAEDDLRNANGHIEKAIQSVENQDLTAAKQSFDTFNSTWYEIEDGIKDRSKAAYKQIEDDMGEVQFAFAKQPVDAKEALQALQKLQETNSHFINGELDAFQSASTAKGSEGSVAGLVSLLDGALADLQKDDAQAAKAKVEAFRKSWLDIEGVVLTQSAKVYGDAERDMVTSYAKLAASPPDAEGAAATIRAMRDYLSPLTGKVSYTMMDVITILLREGLEALLVVVALLGFLNKSGNPEKKPWIWYGVGSGMGISLILGILVHLLFSSGAFGSNNFLIMGFTGIFAAVMLLYMSYWLHSKSSLASWRRYINDKGNKALEKGSLWSLAVLSFLAVFREGTETVLFFIGMASSIRLDQLLLGIALGGGILITLAVLVLKVGLKIPMRPFFLVSSILVFYLCFKFLGMGVHGLQLAGVLQASHIEGWGSVELFALYPTWENLVPQFLLLAVAAAVVLWSRRRDRQVVNGVNPVNK